MSIFKLLNIKYHDLKNRFEEKTVEGKKVAIKVEEGENGHHGKFIIKYGSKYDDIVVHKEQEISVNQDSTIVIPSKAYDDVPQISSRLIDNDKKGNSKEVLKSAVVKKEKCKLHDENEQYESKINIKAEADSKLEYSNDYCCIDPEIICKS